MSARKRRWAVFISGRGSNLAALLDLHLAGAIEISLVLSSSVSAPGLARARRTGIPHVVLSKPIDWTAVNEALHARQISDLFLAGFMRVVPAAFVQRWAGKILNLHPSLLPDFKGLNSLPRAYEADADLGASVHEVTEGVDEGFVFVQRRSLKQPRLRGYSLAQSEFWVHIDEQRLVREAILKWNPRN